jgi:hypothetical protein
MEAIISPIALLITLVGVYVFFKINSLKDLIIGRGAALISNYDDPNFHKDYEDIFDAKQIRRLRDDVLRKNIYGIEEGILNATINELKKPIKSETGCYMHVLPKFIYTKKVYNYLIIISLATLSTLFSSLIFLIIKGLVKYFNEIQIKTLDIIFLILIGISFLLTFVLIIFTLTKKVGFESDKRKLCKKLRKAYPEIDKLYYCP